MSSSKKVNELECDFLLAFSSQYLSPNIVKRLVDLYLDVCHQFSWFHMWTVISLAPLFHTVLDISLTTSMILQLWIE